MKTFTNRNILLPAVVLAGIVVLGLAAALWRQQSSEAGGSSAISGAVSSSDAAVLDLPGFVYSPSAPEGTPTAYQAAIDFGDDFRQIPCYCGCGSRNIGHDSLRDCFIAPGGGGEISFAQHGSACNLCVREALDVIEAKKAGRPIQEIRAAIDEKYGGGKYAGPTPTPPVGTTSGAP